MSKTQATYAKQTVTRAVERPDPPDRVRAGLQPRPVVLTVAGSDSGGGAGIQADLKVFALHGVFGCAVLTGLTAQNTCGVQGIHAVPARFVATQLQSVLGDLPVRVVKTGMLWSRAVVRVVAAAVREARLPLVLDPVMVAKGGDRLLKPDAEKALRDLLLPCATVVTPNLDEASVLVGREVRTLGAMREAARTLVEMGAGAALVKGGHLRGRAIDVLCDGDTLVEIEHPRIRTRHSHGTGCVLSAAICARLALGEPLPHAVRAGIELIASILKNQQPLGHGRGPADPLLAIAVTAPLMGHDVGIAGAGKRKL